MNKQLKIALAVAVTALGYAATAPAQTFPSSATEFSAQTYTPPAKAATQRVTVAATTRTTTSTFPSSAMEP
jgi:P2-related tail formation protein